MAPRQPQWSLEEGRQEGLKERRGPIGFETGSESHGPRYIGGC